MSAVELQNMTFAPAFPPLEHIKASSAIPRSTVPAPYNALCSAEFSSIAPRLLESQASHHPAVTSPLLEPPAPLSLNPSPASTPPLQQSQQLPQQRRQTPQLAQPSPRQARPVPLQQSPLSSGIKRKRSVAAEGDQEDDVSMPETKQQRFVRPVDIYSPEFAQPFNFAAPVNMGQTYYPAPPAFKASSPWKGSPLSGQQQSQFRRVSAPSHDSNAQRTGRQGSTVSSLASVSPHAGHRLSEPPNAYGQTPASFGYNAAGAYNYGGMSPFGTDQYSSSVVQPPMGSMPETGFPPSSYNAAPPRTLPGSFSSMNSGAGLGLQRMPPAAQETPRQKPRCWEHGCNGREFSTFSNLLRHQREKSGTAVKSYCPRCGAEFTRSTAMSNHLQQAKCKARPGSE